MCYDDKLQLNVAFRNGPGSNTSEYLLSGHLLSTAFLHSWSKCAGIYIEVVNFTGTQSEVDVFSNLWMGMVQLNSRFTCLPALVLDSTGEASSAAQSNLAPRPLPLSLAIKILTRVLGGLSPVFLAHALHKIERNAKPERRNDFNPVIDVDSLFEGIEQSQAVSKSYVSESRLTKEKENRKIKERKVLIQFKERLLASCGRDASSHTVITRVASGKSIPKDSCIYV